MTNEELLAHMDLGEQAEGFVKSELGQVVIGLARQQAEAAKDQLAEADPTDAKLIAKLQGEVRWAHGFEAWLADLVQRGREAYDVFRDRTGDA